MSSMVLTKNEKTLEALLNRCVSPEGFVASSILESGLKSVTADQRCHLLSVVCNDGMNRLYYIAAVGDAATVECALNGMEPDQIFNLLNTDNDSGRDSALRIAIKRGELSMIRCMLSMLSPDRCYDLLKVTLRDTRGSEHSTAMHEAAYHGQTDVIKYLLGGVASDHRYSLLTTENTKNVIVFHIASNIGQTESVRCMLDSLAEDQRYELLQMRNVIGNTIIHRAAYTQDREMLLCILDSVTAEQKYNLLKMDNRKGEIAVLVAALSGNAGLVELMLGCVTAEQREELQNITADDGILSVSSLGAKYNYPATDSGQRNRQRDGEEMSDAGSNSADAVSPPSSPRWNDFGDSDISDGEGYLFPRDAPEKVNICLTPRRTTKSSVRDLYFNTNKVYKMSSPIRGRALVINNKSVGKFTRYGSEIDVDNMSQMLQKFNFEVSVFSDLTAEGILMSVSKETKNCDHEDYGMFVMVIMSHGTENDYIHGADYPNTVNLRDVYDLLSTQNFPHMAGKPKFVIVQACSGERMDRGNLTQFVKPVSERPAAPLQTDTLPQELAVSDSATALPVLDADDLLVIKSSFESYSSMRHCELGTLFIRCLVTTFYKHACHRDIWSLCEIVQTRVRRETMELTAIALGHGSGQVPVYFKTLTHGRKLYLFPGCNGNIRKLETKSRKQKRSHSPKIVTKRTRVPLTPSQQLTSDHLEGFGSHTGEVEPRHTVTLDQLKHKIKTLESEKTAFLYKLDEFKQDHQLTVSASKIAELETKLRDCINHSETLNQQLEDCQKRVSKLETSKNTPVEELTCCKNSLDVVTRDLSSCKRRVSELEAREHHANTAAANDRTRHKTELTGMVKKLEEKIEKLRTAVSKIQTGQRELNDFRDRRTRDLSLSVTKLEVEVAKLRATVCRIQEGHQALDSGIAGTEVMVQQTQLNLQEQDNELQGLDDFTERRIEDLWLEITRLEEQVSTLLDGQQGA